MPFRPVIFPIGHPAHGQSLMDKCRKMMDDNNVSSKEYIDAGCLQFEQPQNASMASYIFAIVGALGGAALASGWDWANLRDANKLKVTGGTVLGAFIGGALGYAMHKTMTGKLTY